MHRIADHPGVGPYLRYHFVAWNDGNQQWFLLNSSHGSRYVERLVGPCAKPERHRRRWHIVDRASCCSSSDKYPPIVAGPFENVKVALVAYELMEA